MSIGATPLVCLTLAALAAPVEAPKPVPAVQLRYRFTEGESVRYQNEHQATFLQVKRDIRDKQATRTSTSQRFEVVSVAADGTATLRLAIDAARMEYAFDDAEPTVFDSREKQLPVAAFSGVAQAIGRELAEIKVRSDGAVESVRPLLSARELDMIPGKLGLEGDGPSSLFTVFPHRTLTVGEQWSDTFAVRVTVTERLTQEVKVLRQYRLEAVEKGIARISVKQSLLTPVTEPSMLVQLIQRTSTGEIRFDVRAGRIVSRTTELDNLEIGFAGPESSFRAVCRWTERLAEERTTASAR